MESWNRTDFQHAGKSVKIGCTAFVIGFVLSCASTFWIAWQSVRAGTLTFSFWSCSPLVLFILSALYGAFKMLMGMWEQDEIEARARHGLG